MAVNHDVDEALLEPFNYISENPGKNVRGSLIDAFNMWLGIPGDRVEAIKRIVSRLHNASLLVDDIEDGSQLRRGKPVAHAIFGVPSTLNTANYVYFIALEECHRLDNGEALSRSSDRRKGEFRKLVDLLALYFQIRDDLVNLRSDDYMRSKSYCEDLTEGQRTENPDVKKHAVEYMASLGSFAYTRTALAKLKADVGAEIALLGGHERLAALMDKLDAQIADKQRAPSDELPPPPRGSPLDDGAKCQFDTL
ncbi:hypothetical protein JL721_4769 [Aureococcus anophagefferens]|nr:hypothetical protein JL721_4769 [Aureococcus anophagefferens]